MTEYYSIDNWEKPDSIKLIGTKISKTDRGGFARFSGSPHPIHTAFTIPAAYRDEAKRIIEKRAELKAALEKSMGWVYEFKNRITRGDPPQG